MSGKNTVLFLKSFPCDASTRFGPFEWSIWVSANFSRFEHRINSILHILIELNGAHELAMISLMLDHSKFTKMPFWMIQIAKNEVFGYFLELGASDRLQIAYDDYTKWSWQVGCHIAHAGSFKNHKNAFLNDPNSQKWGFRPFSWVLFIGSTWNCIFSFY